MCNLEEVLGIARKQRLQELKQESARQKSLASDQQKALDILMNIKMDLARKNATGYFVSKGNTQ
jgi:hypothetical protein